MDLGSPARYGSSSPYAEFTTKGGLLYVTAYGFGHGHFLEPDVGHTSIYIGRGSPQSENDEPSNTLASLSVTEDDYSTVELPAGTYWLVGGGYIEVVSCEKDGVTDGKPPPQVVQVEKSNIKPPCGEQGNSRVNLGSPWYDRLDRYQDLSNHAKFTTSGGTLYATATGFVDNLDNESGVPLTTIVLGNGVPMRDEISPLSIWTADEQVMVLEDDFTEFRLEGGTYWVLSSAKANISIVSCEAGGLSDPKPAPVASLDIPASQQQRRSSP